MANMAQAIRMALHYGETHLGVRHIFGEDVGPPLGGVMTKTQGLKTAWNSPLDERGIIGMAMGLALAGHKPVAEIQFADYIFNTIDLLKLAGNTCWSSNGQFSMPMVVVSIAGAGIHGSIYHSHSFDAWGSRLSGWKIVMPSNPYDAYGLMLAAIEDPNPVLYLPPKALLRMKGDQKIPGEPDDERVLRQMIDAPIGDRSEWRPRWPELEFIPVPIGKGKVVREGKDAVIVTYGRHVHLAVTAAEQLESKSMGSAAVIDLRSIYPYDWELIRHWVERTGRVLFLNEDTELTNFGEHLLRRSVDELFYQFKARPRLLAGKHVPGVGLADELDEASVPQVSDIERVLSEMLTELT